MIERSKDDVSRHPEPAAQIIPDRDAEFVAGLGEAQERVAAIAADIAPCPGADLPPRDITADVVLRAVGVERDFRPVQHHQQLGFVGMQPRQQAVQGDEAGAAAEDTVKPGTQRERPAPAGFDPVRLEARRRSPRSGHEPASARHAACR